MAPIEMQALGWAAARSLSPVLVLVSLLCLIGLIKLLAICTQCQRETYDLPEQPEVERTQRQSNLVEVVKMEDTAMPRENPCFEYSSKDEQAPRPTAGNGTPVVSTETDQVWYTPWRSHTESLNRQGHIGDFLNRKVSSLNSVTESPGHSFGRIPRPTRIVVNQEVRELPPAPLEISRQLADAPTVRVRSLQPSEPQADIPEHSSNSPHQQGIQHTYESLEDLSTAASEETESPSYTPAAGRNASSPYLSNHVQGAGSHVLSAPTADWAAKRVDMGLNGMYAQVSKKHKNPTQRPQSLPEGVESVPSPHLLQEEEEDPAPPVPARTFMV